MTSEPITDEQLLAYAAGDLEGKAARLVEARLATDPAAARRVALYRCTAGTVAADDSVAPPAETLARAKSLFTRRATTPRPSLIERLEAVVAQLVFDSRLQPLAVRVGDNGRRFQLAFEADAAEIDLHAERAGDRWRVMGQVSAGSPPEGARVLLTRAGETAIAAEARSDPDGIFAMDVDPGRYDVRLHLTDGLLILPNVEIA